MKTKKINKEIVELHNEISNLKNQLNEYSEKIDVLIRDRLNLAKLSSDVPMFDNPLIVYAIKNIRDSILKDKYWGQLNNPKSRGENLYPK